MKDTLSTPTATPTSSVKASPPTSSSPGDSPPPQPCLALPTNPILIVPYSLFRGASVLAAPALPAPDTACFLLPNGILRLENYARLYIKYTINNFWLKNEFTDYKDVKTLFKDTVHVYH